MLQNSVLYSLSSSIVRCNVQFHLRVVWYLFSIEILPTVNASVGNSAFCNFTWQLGTNTTLNGYLYLVSPPLLTLSASSAPDSESLSIALTPDASDAFVAASAATPTVSTTALAISNAVTTGDLAASTDSSAASTTSLAGATGALATSAAPYSAAGAATRQPPPPPTPTPPMSGWYVLCFMLVFCLVVVATVGYFLWFSRRSLFRFYYLFRFRRLHGGGAHYVFDDDRADLYSLWWGAWWTQEHSDSDSLLHSLHFLVLSLETHSNILRVTVHSAVVHTSKWTSFTFCVRQKLFSSLHSVVLNYVSNKSWAAFTMAYLPTECLTYSTFSIVLSFVLFHFLSAGAHFRSLYLILQYGAFVSHLPLSSLSLSGCTRFWEISRTY